MVDPDSKAMPARDPQRTSHPPGPGSTRAVERALLLLVAATDRTAPTTLTELARATDLSPSTATRLLATLERQNFIRRGEDNRYRPGTRLMQIAATTLREEPIYELAGPCLVELARQTGESANLGIPIEGERVLYLRQVASRQLVQTATWAGRTVPIAGTAIGAAVSGGLNDEGYAATRWTIEPDVTAVAAPVRGHAGDIVGALSVTAPTYRTGDEDVATYGRALVRHAGVVSLSLGAPSNAVVVAVTGTERG